MLTRFCVFTLCLSVLAAGCGATDADPAGSSSSASTGEDACAARNAYGDGHCDSDCPAPDPDCAPVDCPDPAASDVHYLAGSDQYPEVCARLTLSCAFGQRVFSNVCGCGCIDEAPSTLPACPDPSDPRVHYAADSNKNPSACLVMMFACTDQQTLFTNECGCGCIDDVDNPTGPAADFCGGIAGFPCPDGFVCVLDGDYPDAGGYCEAAPSGQFCGGIAGFPCPDGFVCVLDGDYPDAGGHCERVEHP